MAEAEVDEVRARLETYVGKPMGPPIAAPDPVNVPMIRHWVDALDDRNPVYLDADFAARTRFGGIVAPPAMLQAWTMARPKIEGIAERGGAPVDFVHDNPIRALDAAGYTGTLAAAFDDLLGFAQMASGQAGYTGTLATNSELEFVRYLRPGDQLHAANAVDAISTRKTTALGKGYFVTWVTTYTCPDGEVVGRQLFRVFKFDPRTLGGRPGRPTRSELQASEGGPLQRTGAAR